MRSGPGVTTREALQVYKGSALVRRESTQRKADAAFREMEPHLTEDERDAIEWARARFLTDPQGHPHREFNAACDAVLARFVAESER